MRFGHFSQLFNKAGMEAHARYDQMWRELELADELDFDYGFQSIHHFHKLRPTPAVFCTGAAARTEHLRLGVVGYIAGLRDPMVIVEETAVLDHVLKGRLEVGLVPGVYPDYFRVFGTDPRDRRGRAMEAVSLLNTAYRMEEGDLLSFDGPFHQYEEVEFAIRPVQRPGPPIWLPSVHRDTLKFLAQEGAHEAYLHLVDRGEMAPRIGEYLDWWDEAGHVQRPNVGYMTFVYVDETDEAAVEKATPWIVESTNEVYGNPPRSGGRFDDGEERAGPLSAEIWENRRDMAFLMERNLVFVGSPATVAERIGEAAQEGRFNTLFCEFNIGSIGDEDLMRSIGLFGTEVIPGLRELDPTV